MTSPRPGYSGTGRALWVIWCCAWSVAWLVFADALGTVGGPWWVPLGVGVPGSLAAILLPVGKGQRLPR